MTTTSTSEPRNNAHQLDAGCVFLMEQPTLPLPDFQDMPVETIVVAIRNCDGITDDSMCSNCDAAVKKEEFRHE